MIGVGKFTYAYMLERRKTEDLALRGCFAVWLAHDTSAILWTMLVVVGKGAKWRLQQPTPPKTMIYTTGTPNVNTMLTQAARLWSWNRL